MGKASFECWEEMEGLGNVRTLDNMHDYALELALLGREKEGIAKWRDIAKRTPDSSASENTKTVYTYRSLAGISEFQGDAVTAEFFYAQLIVLCEALYNSEHIHVYDYRLSHAEQIMRQGKLEKAKHLSEAILESCTNTSEWRITASCLQTIAECYRLEGCYDLELPYRQRTLDLHDKKLGHHHKETVNAKEALADCYLQSSRHTEARTLYKGIMSWRRQNLGQIHADTLRAMECLGILYARQGQDAEAETMYLEIIDQKRDTDARLLDNLCKSLWNQSKWEALEGWSRHNYEADSDFRSNAHLYLITALEQRGKMENALEIRADQMTMEARDDILPKGRLLPTNSPARDDRRFGRMIHPRTWSA